MILDGFSFGMNVHRLLLIWGTTGAMTFSIMCPASGATEFKHPPTFEDYQRAKANDSHEPAAMDAQVAFFNAALLNSKERNRIVKRGVKEELIGAGIITKVGDSQGIQMLKIAASKYSSDPMTWAALCYQYMAYVGNKERESFTDKEVEQALREFIRTDADNALPTYLMASFRISQGKFDAAAATLRQAAKRPNFKTYLMDIRRSVEIACESSGFSKFTASMVACGQMPGIVSLSKLAKTVVENHDFNSDSARQCFQMGQDLEKDSAFFIEELVSYSIQTRALNKLADEKLTNDAQRIKQRKEFIKRAIAFLESAPFKNLPESRWLAYLNTMFASGEGKAVEELAGELGRKL